ncbi:MAG: winged helix-turn-helix domain-containing protein [Ktedonobacteraceae bacterium]
MARVTRAVAHLSVEEVKHRLKTDPRSWCRQRWLIIYHALIEPRKAEEIAKHCGVSKAMVHQVISSYNRLGVQAVETPGKGGRRHEYLTLEEEQQFLSPFFARAESGEIATSAEIQQAFEARIGHEVDDSTIYRLLNRHGWRKLMPRPKHPKASKEAKAQFKNTLRRRFRRQSQRARQKTNDQSSEWRKMRGALAASHVRNGVGLRPASGLVHLHR